MGFKVDKLAFMLSFLIDFGIFASAAPENEIKMPALAAPLAVGGMMQGLLNMQVRPEGGFYEEKYKEIFKDSSDLFTSVKYDSLLNVDIDELLQNKEPKLTVLEDGKSLRLYVRGRGSNPCFEYDRITKNRLLALVCSLQLRV